MTITSLRIEVSDEQLEDLRARLERARWPSPIRGSGWDDGTDAEFLRDTIDYWQRGYDWRERETRLNALNHHVADIDGETVHFIRAKGRGLQPIPLLLLNGWPSSFVQMLDVIPLLTASVDDDTPSFDIIAASLPGYPLSSLPTRPGMSFARIAELFVKLMEILGYRRFAGRGSDQGGLVLQQIGLRFPERLIGLHRSGITPFADPLPDDLTPEEISYQREVSAWARRETAYADLQRTRPETLAPALTDSPIALASWFLEKFRRWGDCRRGFVETFGLDRLLDNLSLHWFTKSAAASTRLYREAARDPGASGRVDVPTAILMPLHDGATVPAPRSWCERTYQVVRWSVMEQGGHFPEWEVPQIVAHDVRTFFRDLLSTDGENGGAGPQFAHSEGSP